MRANSSLITSRQTGIHDQLAHRVAKHASTQFLKPIADYNRTAFNTAVAAWRGGNGGKLILDAGCGVGLSTLHLASQFPDHFVIGVDQSADRTGRHTLWTGEVPSNYIRVRANLIDFWRLMLDAGIFPHRHYLLYPNPWPKKHHIGRRWHGHPVFPIIVALGGHFECRSNWPIYIDECAAALRQLSPGEVAVEPFPNRALSLLDDGLAPLTLPYAPITPFEEKYLASGHTLWRCITHISAT